MDLLQTILNAQGGQPVNEIGRALGLERNQTVSAIEQLLPALTEGLAKNTAQPGGLEGLLGALAGGGHSKYIEDPSLLGAAETALDGNGILGHVLGSKDVSRQVAARASAQTGISADILKKMLPMLASLAMGAMSQRTRARAPQMPTRPPGQASAGGGLLDMLSPMLDRDRDGSVADDLLGMLLGRK